MGLRECLDKGLLRRESVSIQGPPEKTALLISAARKTMMLYSEEN